MELNSDIFETTPLTGLRGVAAIHIVIFHSLAHCSYGFNIYGQVHMPLFFLLSGFCCTLGYGRKKNQSNSEENITFDTWDYYFGRMARVLPVYYFCYFFALPLVPLGHTFFGPSDLFHSLVGSVLALFLIQSWLLVFGFGPVGPSWTVSTLFFFYLFFPWLLKFAQNRSNRGLTVIMKCCFFLEIGLGLWPYYMLPVISKFSYDDSYWPATAHPSTRILVFLMGICAGVLCNRIQDGDLNAFNCFGRNSENWFLSIVEDSIPLIPCGNHEQDLPQKVKQKSWKRRVDVNMFCYMGTILIFSIINVTYNLDLLKPENVEALGLDVVTNETSERYWDDVIIFQNGVPGMFLQLTSCYIQLMIIVGLCLDGGKSHTSRFLKTRVMQFLGRISMALYLIHEPILFWINFCTYGKVDWPDDKKPSHVKLPLWAIPIHVLISLIFGTILTFYLEEPSRKMLKQWRDKKKNTTS